MLAKYIDYDIEQFIRDYPQNVITLAALTQEYRDYEEIDGVKGIDYTNVKVQSSGHSDGVINKVIRKADLEQKIKGYTEDIAAFERAWGTLTAEEKTFIDSFYLNAPKNCSEGEKIARISGIMNIEQATVYRVKRTLLGKMKTLVFG